MSPVTERPAEYATSDGHSYESRVEAERHEKVLVAKREYEDALLRFGKALAVSHRTADGVLFEFGLWERYWRITPGYQAMPRLERLEGFWGHPGFSFDHRDELEISEDRGGGAQSRRFRLSELYRHEANARAALLVAQEKWLAEQAREVEETRQALKLHPAGEGREP